MASAGPGRPRARLWLTAATLLLLLPGAAGMSCCYHAKDNLMCRDVCEQILSSKSDSRLKHLLQRAPEYCPESMGEVWGCINSSLPGVLKKSDGWVGLGCCELAIAVECRQACKQASSKNDILKICRKEYEACPVFLQPPTPFHCVWMRKLLSAEERTKSSSIEKLLQVAICCDCRHLQMEMQTPVFLKSWPATYIA